MPLQGQRKYLEFSCRSTNYNHLIIAISLSILHLTRYEEDWMVKDRGTYSVQCNNMKVKTFLNNNFEKFMSRQESQMQVNLRGICCQH